MPKSEKNLKPVKEQVPLSEAEAKMGIHIDTLYGKMIGFQEKAAKKEESNNQAIEKNNQELRAEGNVNQAQIFEDQNALLRLKMKQDSLRRLQDALAIGEQKGMSMDNRQALAKEIKQTFDQTQELQKRIGKGEELSEEDQEKAQEQTKARLEKIKQGLGVESAAQKRPTLKNIEKPPVAANPKAEQADVKKRIHMNREVMFLNIFRQADAKDQAKFLADPKNRELVRHYIKSEKLDQRNKQFESIMSKEASIVIEKKVKKLSKDLGLNQPGQKPSMFKRIFNKQYRQTYEAYQQALADQGKKGKSLIEAAGFSEQEMGKLYAKYWEKLH